MIRDICKFIFIYTYLYYFAGVLTKDEKREARDVSDAVDGDLNNLLKGWLRPLFPPSPNFFIGSWACFASHQIKKAV